MSGCAAALDRSGVFRRAGSLFRPASLIWRSIPSIFVLYLGKFSPSLTAGWRGYAWSLAVVAVCCAWNLRGAPGVGKDSVWLFALLVAPFVVFVALGFWHGFSLHPAMHWGRPASGTGGRRNVVHRNPGGSVELHGLGQRLHHRTRCRQSTTELPTRHDRRRHPHGRHVCTSALGDGGGGTLTRRLFNRLVGRSSRAQSAAPFWPWPS